jgi:diacylglycerol kinase family enzyme
MLAERSSSTTQADAAAGKEDRTGAAPLFVVINPGSGTQDPGRTREMLSEVFEQAGRLAHFADVRDPAMLVGACEEAAGEAACQGGILVAAGGDGTINTAAHAAIGHGCPLGVIPQGTFNYLAREHGIPLDAGDAARALLSARPAAVQVGSVNDQLFLVNASLGLYPKLLEDREAFEARWGRHRWVAVLAGLATALRWRRQLSLAVELDGHRTVITTSTLFAANNRMQVERLGIEESVTDRMGQGRLVGLAIRPIGVWTVLGLALRGAIGKLGDADQVVSFSFHLLEVRVLGMRRIKVAVDGEVFRMTLPLRFAVGAERLWLMLPEAPAAEPAT